MGKLAAVQTAERAAFMAALVFAARLDGITQDVENFMLALAEDFAATRKEKKFALQDRDEQEVLNLLSGITSEKTKKMLLRELFFLGYADGNLSDAEVIFIAKVGNKLGVADEVIEKISEWVIRGIEWQEEGDKLF